MFHLKDQVEVRDESGRGSIEANEVKRSSETTKEEVPKNETAGASGDLTEMKKVVLNKVENLERVCFYKSQFYYSKMMFLVLSQAYY